MKKFANELNRVFTKDEVQMATKHMKKFSTSLVIKEIQIKIRLTFHLTHIRMATIKNTNNNKSWQLCREKESSYTVQVNIN
jgi:hypothetical protein